MTIPLHKSPFIQRTQERTRFLQVVGSFVGLRFAGDEEAGAHALLDLDVKGDLYEISIPTRNCRYAVVDSLLPKPPAIGIISDPLLSYVDSHLVDYPDGGAPVEHFGFANSAGHELKTLLLSLATRANVINVYGEKYSQGNGIHDVHQNYRSPGNPNQNKDGAIQFIFCPPNGYMHENPCEVARLNNQFRFFPCFFSAGVRPKDNYSPLDSKFNLHNSGSGEVKAIS